MLENRDFIVDQSLLAIRNTYTVKDRYGQQLGFIKQEFVSWGPKFWLEDNAGAHIGEIDGKVITAHHEYEIKDKDGQCRAKVKKKILKLFGSEWWMQDQKGNELARIKGNIVHHTYDIVAPDKTVIAKVHLNWASMRDEYCIEIVKQGFDPLMVLGYAIAMDHVEHKDRGPASTSINIVKRLLRH